MFTNTYFIYTKQRTVVLKLTSVICVIIESCDQIMVYKGYGINGYAKESYSVSMHGEFGDLIMQALNQRLAHHNHDHTFGSHGTCTM